MISPEKQAQLKERMEKLGIREQDLEESFTLSSGPGGQNVQKNETCVLLKHLPSQIQVKCQKERSREMNRFFARRLLCEKLEGQILGKKSPEEIKREKIRKQKRRRQRRSQSDSASDLDLG